MHGCGQVMALQTARYLISSLEAVARGESVNGSVRYLTEAFPKCWEVATPADLRRADTQMVALRVMASSLVKVCCVLCATCCCVSSWRCLLSLSVPAVARCARRHPLFYCRHASGRSVHSSERGRSCKPPGQRE